MSRQTSFVVVSTHWLMNLRLGGTHDTKSCCKTWGAPMASLDIEVRKVQNPAFGAAILAAFIQGFYEADETKQGTPLPYVFVVLPMILHSEIYRLLAGTKPSLRHMA